MIFRKKHSGILSCFSAYSARVKRLSIFSIAIRDSRYSRELRRHVYYVFSVRFQVQHPLVAREQGEITEHLTSFFCFVKISYRKRQPLEALFIRRGIKLKCIFWQGKALRQNGLYLSCFSVRSSNYGQ